MTAGQQIRWALDWITSMYGTGARDEVGLRTVRAHQPADNQPVPDVRRERAPLSVAQRRILGLMAGLGQEATAGWLAEQTGRSAPGTGQMLATLEKRGLVRKSTFRGRQFWQLTEAGWHEAPPQC